jgi:hypothetical protein
MAVSNADGSPPFTAWCYVRRFSECARRLHVRWPEHSLRACNRRKRLWIHPIERDFPKRSRAKLAVALQNASTILSMKTLWDVLQYVRVKLTCNKNGDVQPDILAHLQIKNHRPHQGDTMMKKLALFVGVEFV